MDPKNDVDVASSELQSSYRSSCGQEASGTEQRLPDELLEMIAQEADFDDLKNLALTNKWLSEACKPMLWRSVVIEGDFEEHEDRMVRLVRAGVGRYIRKIHYTQTRPFSKLSAFHLITFTDLRIAILNPPAPAAETVEAKHSAVPLALSDALKQLPKLTYLSLDRHRSFADTSFSLARHIPQLQELLIPYFPYSNQHSDRPFIHPSPPALRRLEIGFDVLAAQAVASTAGTVQQLLIGNRMFGDWDVEPLALFVELQRVFEELVKGMPTTPWALDNLWLAGFQMGSDPEHLDGLLGVLSALQESPITRLRISGFFSFEYSMDDRTFTLPSVTQLDLQTDIEDVRRDFLTEDTFRSLCHFLRCFPNLRKLTLANWTYSVDPSELASLDSQEQDAYWPLLRPLLNHIHSSTKIDVLRIKQRKRDAPCNRTALEATRQESSFNFKIWSW